MDVLFDDVQVEHRPGLQGQENSYEPWGLSLAGLDYSSPNLMQVNHYQFNGKEQEHELGLGWQDFNWRHYDPAMARFFGVDRLASKFVYMTDYQFASNNPASKIELDGLEGVSFQPGYIESLLWKDTGIMNDEAGKQVAVDVAKHVAKEVAIQAAIMATGEVAELAYGSYLLGEVTVLGRAGGEAAEVATQGARVVEGVPTAASTAEGEAGAAGAEGAKSSGNKPGSYSHSDAQNPLPRNPDGTPAPDGEAAGRPHTRLGREEGSKGPYNQAREFNSNGKPVKDVDFTDHGRPQNHTNPHQHPYISNKTGGTLQRGKQEPLQY